MKPERLEFQPLTAEAFAPFGEVIQRQGVTPESINYGQTQKYADLAWIDTTERDGETTVHLYRSQAVMLPFLVERMERHPLGSQAFIPLHHRPFPVVVAPASDRLDPGSIRCFITDGTQGVQLNKGVWHHHQLSLGETSDYVVIERDGPGENTIEQALAQPLIIAPLQNR